LARSSRNFDVVGEYPFPPPLADGHYFVTEPHVQGSFAYIARADDERVTILDISNEAAPAFHCDILLSGPGTENDVEDVLVFGRWVYAAVYDARTPAGGVRIYDILDPMAPVCPALETRILNTPGPDQGNSLFLFFIGGIPHLFVADPDPPNLGVFIYDLTVPDNPALVGIWTQTSPICSPGDYCAPATITVRDVGGVIMMFVATLLDGVYVVDVGNPALPVSLAHFTYDWTAGDADGDTVADPCDRWGDGDFDDEFADTAPGQVQIGVTAEAAALLLDGAWHVATSDQAVCGGHLMLWSLSEVLVVCPDSNPCAPPPSANLPPPPISEHWVTTHLPLTSAEILGFEPFVFAAWTEEGLELVDLSMPEDPVSVGYHDTLEPNTDGCLENGFPPDAPPPAVVCSWTTAVPNRGFWGAYGLFADPLSCRIYLTGRGSPDNDAAPGTLPYPGSFHILRYTGGPEPNQELRVRKDPEFFGDLVFTWGEVLFASTFSLYRGTIGSAFAYDHQMIDWAYCNQPVNAMAVRGQYSGQPNYYYLLTARNGCGDPEGNYGYASDGTARPSAQDLGNPQCP